jgi:hypothetical protein
MQVLCGLELFAPNPDLLRWQVNVRREILCDTLFQEGNIAIPVYHRQVKVFGHAIRPVIHADNDASAAMLERPDPTVQSSPYIIQ